MATHSTQPFAKTDRFRCKNITTKSKEINKYKTIYNELLRKKRGKSKTLSIEKILSIALEQHSKGNILEAEKYYKVFLNKGFSNSSVLTNLAVIYYQKNQTAKAINLLERSIKEFPNEVSSYSNLATILRDLDKLKEAELLARKAISLKIPDLRDSTYD